MNEQNIAKLTTGLGIWIGGLVLLAILFFSVNYRVTPTRLWITILGIPIRSIRIRDIRHMGTDPKLWAERWYNTLSPENRRLVIRRKHGILCRTMILTPKNPYVLMHELEQAKDVIKAGENKAGEKSPYSRAGTSR